MNYLWHFVLIFTIRFNGVCLLVQVSHALAIYYTFFLIQVQNPSRFSIYVNVVSSYQPYTWRRNIIPYREPRSIKMGPNSLCVFILCTQCCNNLMYSQTFISNTMLLSSSYDIITAEINISYYWKKD
jgi:hypothetical protein